MNHEARNISFCLDTRISLNLGHVVRAHVENVKQILCIITSPCLKQDFRANALSLQKNSITECLPMRDIQPKIQLFNSFNCIQDNSEIILKKRNSREQTLYSFIMKAVTTIIKSVKVWKFFNLKIPLGCIYQKSGGFSRKASQMQDQKVHHLVFEKTEAQNNQYGDEARYAKRTFFAMQVWMNFGLIKKSDLNVFWRVHHGTLG